MELLNISEAARLLGVSAGTLRAWSDKGLVEVVKLPTGVRRYRPEAIRELRQRMVQPATEQPKRPAPA